VDRLRTCSRCGRTFFPLAEYDENDDPPGPVSVFDDQIVCRRCVTAWEELMVKGELRDIERRSHV
jgi:DNA-directed RNA polymerase subunit RPC12/RpoP